MLASASSKRNRENFSYTAEEVAVTSSMAAFRVPGECERSEKERLYDNYVSSGQASPDLDGAAAIVFQSRAAYINSIIKRHIPANKALRIVDLGCGHGAFLYFLRDAGYHNVVGVDGSLEQVAAAHKLGIMGVYHQSLGDYISKAEEGSADVVLLIDVLEHLTRPELLSVLDGAFRILAPGGTCVAHVPNGAGIFGMGVLSGDLTHEMAFTSRSAGQAFSIAGFRSVTCFEDRPIVHGTASFARSLIWTLGTLPVRLLYAAETGDFSVILSRNLLVTCKK
jgi:SAM-dependent methyltransferase